MLQKGEITKQRKNGEKQAKINILYIKNKKDQGNLLQKKGPRISPTKNFLNRKYRTTQSTQFLLGMPPILTH